MALQRGAIISLKPKKKFSVIYRGKPIFLWLQIHHYEEQSQINQINGNYVDCSGKK